MEWVIVWVLIYFAPSLIALHKQKKNTGAIITVNLIAGWTILGWFIALIWAMTND